MTLTAQLLHKRPRVTHDEDRHDWRGGLLFTLIFCLTIAWLDSMDNAGYWKREAERANGELAAREARESLPNPAIVLDAATAERFGLRLAEIAGGLDGERMKLRRLPK